MLLHWNRYSRLSVLWLSLNSRIVHIYIRKDLLITENLNWRPTPAWKLSIYHVNSLSVWQTVQKFHNVLTLTGPTCWRVLEVVYLETSSLAPSVWSRQGKYGCHCRGLMSSANPWRSPRELCATSSAVTRYEAALTLKRQQRHCSTSVVHRQYRLLVMGRLKIER